MKSNLKQTLGKLNTKVLNTIRNICPHKFKIVHINREHFGEIEYKTVYQRCRICGECRKTVTTIKDNIIRGVHEYPWKGEYLD